MSDTDLRRRRLALLETHFQSEVEHDWDACLATFKDVPRYEIVPLGHVHEGAEAVRAYHTAQRRAFPDQRHENVRMHVSDDDTIVAEFDLLGTNTGPFMGLEPTGEAFRIPVVAIFFFDGEAITNERVYLDVGSLMRQIGRTELLPHIGNDGFAAAQMR